MRGISGMLTDTTTLLDKTAARWYDSFTSVFISQDPIGFNDGGTNLAMYCNNSTVNYTDPSGLFAVGSGYFNSTVTDGLWRAAGGVFTMAAGIVTAETGIGAVVAVKGADNVWSGLAQAFTGQPVPSAVSRLVGPNADAVRSRLFYAQAVMAESRGAACSLMCCFGERFEGGGWLVFDTGRFVKASAQCRASKIASWH
jgi:RHS repeat-associated protein